MKKTLMILTFGLITYSSFGQWSNTSNNQTQGAVKIKDYLLFDADGDFTGGNYFTIQDDPTTNNLRIGYGFNNHLNINSQGNIGIGTATPQSPLEINQENNPYNDSALVISEPNNSQKIYLHLANSSSGQYGFFSLGGNTKLRGNGKQSSFDGALGIGTINVGSWKLAVNGKIRAKEIKVETGWSDFVFYDDYKLPTLKEVEKHIKEKGHLKDIPSAKEVKENGVFLGEMDAKLLQKIEELTLYTIDQQKEIEKLKKENNLLKSLLKRVSEIEKKLLEDKK